MRIIVGLAITAAWLAGCVGTSIDYKDLRIAPDAYIVMAPSESRELFRLHLPEANCRDRALLRAAELTLLHGYRYYAASTPAAIASPCEIHIRMFSDRPECEECVNAVFYGATVTRESLEAVLEP